MTKIPIEVSARHLHCDQATWRQLFGDEAIELDRPISQPSQFVATQRVTLSGPAGTIQRVAVVGPLRDYVQVELALSDARRLGVQPTVSASGDLTTAADIAITGSTGEITIPAAIIPQRHIHLSPSEAADLKLENGTVVSVKVDGPRGGVFDRVLVRVHPDFTLRMHIDTDEANAFGITPGIHGTLVV